ncbi:pepsin/retropepsin-like aspartic protease family protein [Winogradskyella bathintestinalis]|uniref:Aspartyl protease family protein n=1 Tax=Winogradskyella bathintestinalis TaxID=3035208 RepID=A0ABT7ZV78_9FLAO|nr:aspartyl protease family protein [Winogradskyella bathintestinalis]MDN3492877.1 aspartyl protease family protein [Winogradskyella bathintestinalis]
MKLRSVHIVLYLLSCNFGILIAQESFFLKEDISTKIDFDFVGNLIIIPLEINDVVLSFILDSGVSKPILFNLSENDSLYLENTETFYLHGLGGNGKLRALKSNHNKLKIGNAVGLNKDLYVVFDTNIDFTPRLGVEINGIIGYDIFKDFVVEINYASKYIRLYNPAAFKPKSSKKWKSLPIVIHKNKPYLDANVTILKDKIRVRLLIDTGSSDALWLLEDEKAGLIPKHNLIFKDYLGKGLSGSIYGKRSKVNTLKLSEFNLTNANVAFPDSLSIDLTKIYKDRKGSLGGDVLKRFNLFFDYTNKRLYIRKNSGFKEPFTYNNSGIVLEYNGTKFVKDEINMPSFKGFKNKDNNAVKISRALNYRMLIKPIYKIVEIRKSSNAYLTGLRVNDILVGLNGRPAYKYKLSEINKIFHGKTGKMVRLSIERLGEKKSFKFKLDNVFNQKKEFSKRELFP